jgi:hypothetical protein
MVTNQVVQSGGSEGTHFLQRLFFESLAERDTAEIQRKIRQLNELKEQKLLELA